MLVFKLVEAEGIQNVARATFALAAQQQFSDVIPYEQLRSEKFAM